MEFYLAIDHAPFNFILTIRLKILFERCRLIFREQGTCQKCIVIVLKYPVLPIGHAPCNFILTIRLKTLLSRCVSNLSNRCCTKISILPYRPSPCNVIFTIQLKQLTFPGGVTCQMYRCWTKKIPDLPKLRTLNSISTSYINGRPMCNLMLDKYIFGGWTAAKL